MSKYLYSFIASAEMKAAMPVSIIQVPGLTTITSNTMTARTVLLVIAADDETATAAAMTMALDRYPVTDHQDHEVGLIHKMDRAVILDLIRALIEAGVIKIWYLKQIVRFYRG